MTAHEVEVLAYRAKYGEPAEFDVYLRIAPETEYHIVKKTQVTPFLAEESDMGTKWTLKKGWKMGSDLKYALWIDVPEEKTEAAV